MTTVSQLDYLVIGAGPAGLQLGYYLEKAGRNYLILESGDSVGTFFQRYPRHRQLISINKVYTGYDDTEINLRWDWNSLLCDDDALLFKHYSRDYFPNADRLVDYLQDFAKHYALQVKCNSQVVNISRDGDFRVEDCHGNLYIAKRVIIAAGFTQLYMPPIRKTFWAIAF
jgi:cation diffusion facilitator CzcD-associated flavoprotein CzcO